MWCWRAPAYSAPPARIGAGPRSRSLSAPFALLRNFTAGAAPVAYPGTAAFELPNEFWVMKDRHGVPIRSASFTRHIRGACRLCA